MVGMILALFFVLSGIPQGDSAKPHVNCEVTWEKIGCFKDSPDRALPIELINDRDPISNNYKGYHLDWEKFGESTRSLACRCAAAAKERGYKVFGLQFFAECWSGPGGELTYYKHNKANDDMCYQDIYNPSNVHCDKSVEQECVGTVWTNYVYRLKEVSEQSSVDKNGNYSEWGPWTRCSKSCGGGTQVRERTCTNPKPFGRGRNCDSLGPAEEELPCNQEECPKPCTKALDVGIVLDVSSSVEYENFNTSIKFIKDLMKYFTVSADGTHFGVITYSSKPHLQFKLTDERYFDHQNLAKRMDQIKYNGGSTFTVRAMRMASDELFKKDDGDRPDKPNVLIVFTDGNTNHHDDSWGSAIFPLHSKRVRVIAVGIGKGIDKSELDIIAWPNKQYVIEVKNFDLLVKKMATILADACEGRK